MSAYIFGAICPERGVGAALVLPRCNTQAMQWHLDEISSRVMPGAHAILIVDRAGWHITDKLAIPDNITLLPLPARSPELHSCRTGTGWILRSSATLEVFEERLGGCFVSETFSGR